MTLWYEFILHTREYHRFCRGAFGRYLHHTPAVVLRKDQKHGNEGLRRVWTYACREEGIELSVPKSLPLLFGLDAALRIPNGVHYAPDCDALRRHGVADAQCGGDMSCGSIDGGTAGLGDGGDGDGGGGDRRQPASSPASARAARTAAIRMSVRPMSPNRHSAAARPPLRRAAAM